MATESRVVGVLYRVFFLRFRNRPMENTCVQNNNTPLTEPLVAPAAYVLETKLTSALCTWQAALVPCWRHVGQRVDSKDNMYVSQWDCFERTYTLGHVNTEDEGIRCFLSLHHSRHDLICITKKTKELQELGSE